MTKLDRLLELEKKRQVLRTQQMFMSDEEDKEYESLISEINAQLEFDPEMTRKICPKCNSETTTRAYDDGMTSDGRQYWDYKTSCTKCEWSEWD